jgi:hypothetical protein
VQQGFWSILKWVLYDLSQHIVVSLARTIQFANWQTPAAFEDLHWVLYRGRVFLIRLLLFECIGTCLCILFELIGLGDELWRYQRGSLLFQRWSRLCHQSTSWWEGGDCRGSIFGFTCLLVILLSF